MMNTVTAKDPAKAERRAIPVRTPTQLQQPNFQALLDNWTPQTDILKQIKSNDPKRVMYLMCTHEMAMDLLKLNDPTHNRRIKWSKIQVYSKSIQNKRWKERNGETIKVSKTLKLLDGQHRLWSIALTKIPVEIMLTTGIDDDAFAYIDLGSNRSAADITSIHGYQNYDNQLAYAIKCIILFERSSLFKGTVSAQDVPNWDVHEWQEDADRMARLLEELHLINKVWMKKNKKFFTAAQWLAILYILRTLPGREKDAKAFLMQFIEGNDLTRTSPIKVVRSYFENGIEQLVKYKKRNKVTRNILTLKVKYLFAAWDLWLEGASVSSITIDQENLEIKKPSFTKRRVA